MLASEVIFAGQGSYLYLHGVRSPNPPDGIRPQVRFMLNDPVLSIPQLRE